ncbi:uncharacterized protein LOC122380784 [Amphibalanus amphitrite]|uniref:uncharacterized protein LOC122380784 n=1 Tax=Amphibalanus amphitrite TaxID=1232801 RepID=UPI001C911073|nr:uncharacterized protein LOC122380784 [Amphibalanus amphitrite]
MDAGEQETAPMEPLRAAPRRPSEKFTAAMRTFLLSQVMERWSVVTDVRIDDRAVYSKRRAWTEIAAQFGQRFPGSGKTVQQLKDLWKRHSIQFRRESREELALEEATDSAVPNELMFQKLLEWLESNPGEEGGGVPDGAPPVDEGEPEPKEPRRTEEAVEKVEVKDEPPPTPPRVDTPSADSGGSAEEAAGRRSAEILSSADKHYLIMQCFRAYDIIGSTRLDSPALRQKRKTWVEICTEYNRKFGRNLGISTVKGVWRRFVKQRKDDLMKTLKLRNKEEVTEDALLEDMKAFLSSYREAHGVEESDDVPLYKRIRADVEERPLTASHRSQRMSPEQILNQLRRLTPAPPPLRAANGAAAMRRRPTTPSDEPDEGLMSEEEETAEGSMLDPRDRLGCDVSITVVDPESRPSSGGGRPASPSARPAAPTAPLAAAPGDTLSDQLERDRHRLQMEQLRERHQLELRQLREKHHWEAEKTRLEAEILSMRRDYWCLLLDRCRAGVTPHPAQL